MEEINIKLPTPYKYEERIITKMEGLQKNGDKIINAFIGFREVTAIFYLYLFKKYKTSCFLYNDNNEFSVLGLNIDIMSNASNKKKRLFNDHINVLANAFTECVFRNEKHIIVPLTIYDNKDVIHSNVLVYRKKFHQIEHFEPHGDYYMSDEKRSAKVKQPILKFIAKVNSILKERGRREIEYIPTEEVCPTEDGLQALEGVSTLETNEFDSAGYCIPWNMFFTELCLANPNIESKELFEIITNYFKDKTNIEDYLRKVIRGYSVYIDEKVNKYLSIIMSENMTITKIHQMYGDYQNKYQKIEVIRKSLLELLKLETYMITDKSFNLDKEIKKVRREMKDKSVNDDIELLLKKKVLENYEKFNSFTPVTSENNSSSIQIMPIELSDPIKKCPEGKFLNSKTKRCNKIKPIQKTKAKTKKNKSSETN